MNYRKWNIDFSFCVGDYEDVELFRHNNHSVLLSRYVGGDKKEPTNWFGTVRVSKIQKLVSLLGGRING